MQPILIGSRALAYWDKSFKLKENTDWDVISVNPIEGAEFHDANFLNNYNMRMYSVPSDLTLNGVSLDVISLDGLRLIKRSHLWREYNFEKHMCHYVKHIMPSISRLGTRPYDLTAWNWLLEERISLTKKAFPQTNPKLNVTKDDFFDDYVVKKYDHDLLHEIVSYYDKPMYSLLQDGTDSVWCSKSKWDELEHFQKCYCVAEEAYVIAAERFLIRSDWKKSKRISFIWAMNKICTTLTSGWFRDFAIDNYAHILDNVYDEARLNKLQRTLKLIGE